jgi:poly(A) polymerase
VTTERIVAEWLAAAETRAVVAALSAGGATIRFVGGCVRDAILGLAPEDIDLATPEQPGTVIRRLRDAGLKAVPSGVEHGTVTAVAPPRAFQITTLRKDVKTDGRHAVVEFGTDWQADAERRDFTINALYADPDGTLHDFTHGRADLAAGLVRFVGAPRQRVAEDYLRVLRFFRFYARFGRGGPDAESLAACGEAAQLVGGLSGERVRDELLKIIALPNAATTLRLMHGAGVLSAILPGAELDGFKLDKLATLIRLQQALAAETDAEPSLWPRLALLIAEGDPAQLAERLKLSNAQRVRLEGLVAHPLTPADLEDDGTYLHALYRLGTERGRDLALLTGARDPQLAEMALRRAAEAVAWRRPTFPLRGADLLALGLSPGPTISALLNELEAWWIDGGYQADREACLARLQQRVQIAPES